MTGTKKECLNWLLDAEGDEFEVKESKRKRSNDANAFYWLLVTQYARYRKTSNDELHSEMLGKYSVADTSEDGSLVVITVKSVVPISRLPGHWREAKSNGDFTAYFRIKGSSDMNTKEFSDLLDGLIEEIEHDKHNDPRRCTIDTMTPKERALLKGYMPRWQRDAQENESTADTEGSEAESIRKG